MPFAVTAITEVALWSLLIASTRQPLIPAVLRISSAAHAPLVVLVKAHSLDVVPRGRLVAEVALAYVGVRLARHLHGHHVEMSHVVAGRRLVTLSALRRTRRRMAKFRDAPLARRMAGGAVLAE